MWLLDPPLVDAVPCGAKLLNAMRVAIDDDLPPRGNVSAYVFWQAK